MKAALYDWGGANVWLFHLVNDRRGGVLDSIMLLGTQLSDYRNFAAYVTMAVLAALLAAARESVSGESGRRTLHTGSAFDQCITYRWIATLAVFCVAYFADGLLLTLAKPWFDFPRPLLSLPANAVHVIGKPELRQRFPSGHASFAVTFVASIWPMLRRFSRCLAVLFVCWVCLSRINVGAHFPADIIGAIVTALLVVFCRVDRALLPGTSCQELVEAVSRNVVNQSRSFNQEDTEMSRLSKWVVVIASLIFGLGNATAQDAQLTRRLTKYVQTNVKPWLSDPVVVDSIKKQNIETAKLKDIDINKLDIVWMDRSNKELIDSKMNNALSTFLTKKKEAANGVIFEIFVFDNRGLNVGQTDMTQDYNQGDEAKYWKSFQVGPNAIFVDKVGKDKGRNVSQVSLTIKDPSTGKAIGAITVGIDVDKLK